MSSPDDAPLAQCATMLPDQALNATDALPVPLDAGMLQAAVASDPEAGGDTPLRPSPKPKGIMKGSIPTIVLDEPRHSGSTDPRTSSEFDLNATIAPVDIVGLYAEELTRMPSVMVNSVLRNALNELKRVVVFAPRLSSFSKRPLTSIRHPRMSYTVWERKIAHLPANPMRRVEKIDQNNAAYLRREAMKWNDVSSVFETLCVLPGASQLRMSIQGNTTFKYTVMRIWEKLVAPVGAAAHVEGVLLSQLTYFYFEVRLYVALYHPSSIFDCLETIEQDWVYDSHGAEGIAFEWFLLSMFDLADNWTSSTRVEEYSAFLNDLAVKVFAADWEGDADVAFAMVIKKHGQSTSVAAQQNFYQWQERHMNEQKTQHSKFLSNLMAEELSMAEDRSTPEHFVDEDGNTVYQVRGQKAGYQGLARTPTMSPASAHMRKRTAGGRKVTQFRSVPNRLFTLTTQNRFDDALKDVTKRFERSKAQH